MQFDNFEVLLSTIDNGVILVDENLNVLYWNLWLETRTGIKSDTILNKPILEFFPDIKSNILKRKIKTVLALNSPTFYNAENSTPLIKIKQPKITEKEFIYMQQSITIVPYNADKKIVCLYVYDNTRLSEQNQKLKQLTNKLEKEIIKNKEKDRIMYEQSKMAALGDMIHNIAHQWRQPLSVISTSASGVALQHKMGILDENLLIESMDTINSSAQYLSKIIDTFRGFVNRHKEFKLVDITKEIKEALEMVKPSLKHHKIEFIEQNDCLSKSHYNEMICYELPETIINIINNAKDAIVDNNICDGWVKLDIEESKDLFTITIEDNAGGISENIITKIFEPYFTTKYNSRGTGLGLHICYRIIKESLDGDIYAKNTSNGAKFFIEIPKNTERKNENIRQIQK